MIAIADWRDKSAYPIAGDETLLACWHWEFLRRNMDYQRDFDEFKALTDGLGDREKKHKLARKYGLDEILFDYRDDLAGLFKSPRDPEMIRTVRWQTAWVREDQEGFLIEGNMENLDYLDPVLRQHELGVIFNVRHPVDKQIENAHRVLLQEYKRHEEKRGRIENYQIYLRLLDADVMVVSYDEIAEVIYPDVEIRLARKRIEEYMKLARQLRDVNYIYI
jgi:hypothetical protein